MGLDAHLAKSRAGLEPCVILSGGDIEALYGKNLLGVSMLTWPGVGAGFQPYNIRFVEEA